MQLVATHDSAPSSSRLPVDRERGLSRLRFVGALDAQTAAEARILVDGVVAGDPDRVIVDLAQVDRIDSVGVSVLVSLYKRVTAHGGTVTLVNVHAQPLVVLNLLKLTKVFGL